MLSGRFADSLGTLYLGYACLWYYNNNRNVEGIDQVLELAMEQILQVRLRLSLSLLID